MSEYRYYLSELYYYIDKKNKSVMIGLGMDNQVYCFCNDKYYDISYFTPFMKFNSKTNSWKYTIKIPSYYVTYKDDIKLTVDEINNLQNYLSNNYRNQQDYSY